VLAAAVVAAVGALLGGCGGDDPAPARPLQPVRLQITAPADEAIVRGGNVDVRGRVTPAVAEATVLGRPALVTQGRFTVVVPLEPGANVIDVIATAPRRKAALAALRGHPAGREAAIIGRVRAGPRGSVVMATVFGGERIVDMLVGEQLPRIC